MRGAHAPARQAKQRMTRRAHPLRTALARLERMDRLSPLAAGGIVYADARRGVRARASPEAPCVTAGGTVVGLIERSRCL